MEVTQKGKTAAVFVGPFRAKEAYIVQRKSLCNFFEVLMMMLGLFWCLMRFNVGLGELVTSGHMTLAKPLAGGMLIGAVLVTERVSSAINYGDHRSTFAGGPLVC
ncbi:hypothetical protein CDL15_Pgr007647 [Punica granatum]|uniref:Uncharacterized protein n=1 Tax=Punica granatum TaxID=22663 RepID=A0A218XA88_PUNGR|nr:hypothetical protein CDL15_Pgr007647 [Punica granatum]PKI40973.1 hypothetical protein CRG98_038501 [Punica granatum]